MLELEYMIKRYALWKYIDRQVYKTNSSLSISDGTYKGYKMVVRKLYIFSELLISHIPKNYKKIESRYINTADSLKRNIVISDKFINQVIEQVGKIKDSDLRHYRIKNVKDNIILFKRTTNGIH